MIVVGVILVAVLCIGFNTVCNVLFEYNEAKYTVYCVERNVLIL